MENPKISRLSCSKITRRTFLQISTLTAFSVIVHGCQNEPDSLVEIFPQPKRFSRRSGKLSVNIGGLVSLNVRESSYQLNDGRWYELPQGRPRVPPPLFNIELTHEKLNPGENKLTIEAKSKEGLTETKSIQFEYDPKPITLPITINWENSDLDMQDGFWEVFQNDKGWRVRPKPGFEEYDRILNLTGSFPEGRRIETNLIFRSDMGWRKWKKELRGDHGFGVLSMWGGHIEEENIRPRRGWHYGLGWYWEHNGLGLEFAEYRHGKEWQKSYSYKDFVPKVGVQYFITIECWPKLDAIGEHQHYIQRMKWWAEDETIPETWMIIDDIEMKKEVSILEPGEYIAVCI